ncbi:MAG: hypothetical protein WBA12_14320 [Catalinimonas sp.]
MVRYLADWARFLRDEEGLARTLPVAASRANRFRVFRSSDHPNRRLNRPVERYRDLGTARAEEGTVLYAFPARSVTTFFESE